MIRFACPSCQTPIEANDDWGGQNTWCTSCGREVRLPFPAALPADDSPAVNPPIPASGTPADVIPPRERPFYSRPRFVVLASGVGLAAVIGILVFIVAYTVEQVYSAGGTQTAPARSPGKDSQTPGQAVTTATGALVLGVVVLGAYFLPTVIAYRRKHPAADSITIVNLFLGWTYIGWVAALAWAVGPIEVGKEYR